MGGFKIGIGVGLKYSTPINVKGGSVSHPEEDINDAILLEGDNGVLLMEDGSYIALENVAQTLSSKATKASSRKSTRSIDKSYWNF